MKSGHLESNEIQEIRELAKQFALKELAPYAEENDRHEKLSDGIFKKMAEIGILGPTVSESDGGAGLSPKAAAAIIEELSYYCPGTALSYLAHTILFVHNLNHNGSKEQKEKYLPKTLTGECVGGVAISEPGSGSDAVGMRTFAKRYGDIYLLNGTKMFITNGPIGDYFLVYAKTAQDRRAISTFIIEKNFKGFSVGKKLSKMGMRASPTSELIFENCEVPVANRIGEEGATIVHMLKNLDIERICLAAISLGIIRACLDHSLNYSNQRQQFDQNIINFQSIGNKIADMFIGYKSASSFVYEVADLLDQNKRCNQEAAAAKIYASEVATKVALDAIQVFGGYGYIREFPVERLMRDAKLIEIGGGTSEILRSLIVKEFIRRN